MTPSTVRPALYRRIHLHIDRDKLPVLDRLARKHSRSRAGEIRAAIARHLEAHEAEGSE